MDILLLALRLLLAAALYAFLATVILMLWRDLRQAAASSEAPRPTGRLVVLSAEYDGLDPGTIFPLQPIMSIGRASLNTVTIPDTYASARHALLTWREGRWWLEDQGSRNGTLLNGVAISAPTAVSAGDVIGIGRTQFKLELD